MTGIRKAFFGILAALGLIMVFACSLLPGNLKDGVIALNVGTSGQFRALDVKDYEVESLDLEILAPDPDNAGEEISVWTEHWVAPESQRYLVQGIGAGTYRIVVTHNGVNGDESLSVTEDETFTVEAMKITTINVIPGLLGVLEVEGDEPDPIDLTGHWTCFWDSEALGGNFGPLYIYLEQIGNDIVMPYGFSGTVSGDTMTMTGYLDEMGLFESTGDIIDEDHISGPFTITPEGSSTPIATGTSTTFRTDQALLGHLEILGYSPIIDMSLDTDEAMAFYSINEEEDEFGNVWIWESLSISFATIQYDVSLEFEVDMNYGSLQVGVPMEVGVEDPAYPGRLRSTMRYLVDGVGIDETDSMDPPLFTGTLLITELVPDDHVAGNFVTDNPLGTDYSMDTGFNLPLAPPMPW